MSSGVTHWSLTNDNPFMAHVTVKQSLANHVIGDAGALVALVWQQQER